MKIIKESAYFFLYEFENAEQTERFISSYFLFYIIKNSLYKMIL